MSWNDPTQQPPSDSPQAPQAPQEPPATPATAGDTPPPAESAPAAAEAPQAPAQSDADLASQIDSLKAKLDSLEQRASSGQLTAAPSDQQLVQKVKELRSAFENWPADQSLHDQPQPWDLQAHGLPQPGVTRDHLPGGQPDELSPVVVAHNLPQLTAGSAGDPVAHLADLLHRAGYDTSISRGENHAAAFDDSVAAAVATFKRDYHVAEDPSGFADPRMAERFVGPYVWEALIRAADLAGRKDG